MERKKCSNENSFEERDLGFHEKRNYIIKLTLDVFNTLICEYKNSHCFT